MLVIEQERADSAALASRERGADGSKTGKIAKILKRHDHVLLASGALCFLDVDQCNGPTTQAGIQGAIQGFLKRYGRVYYSLVSILGPVWSDSRSRRMRRDILSRYDEADIILNLGSGPMVFGGRRDIINVDIFPFDEVDLVADAANLPIESDTVNCIINIAMLEHVPDPQAVVDEMRRVIRAGGEFLCFVPFMQPYHAAPHDYQRWTIAGARELFSRFDDVTIVVSAGPTSGMLWVLQEWIATLLSFGSRRIHDVLLLLVMVLTFPIKFLDELLARSPTAPNVASGFFVAGRKKSPQRLAP